MSNKPTSRSRLKNNITKQIISPKNCPLCHCEENEFINKYEIKDLSAAWTKQHNYDPFMGRTGHFSSYRCRNCSVLHFSPQIIGDENLYQFLGTQSWYYEKNKWEFNESINICKKAAPRRILEIGCGNGDFLSLATEHNLNIEGIDINTKAIEQCREKNLKASTTPLNEISEKYDMVVAFQIFEHLDKVKEVLEHALNILTPKGTLIIAVPNPDGYLKTANSNLLNLPPHHSLHFPKETFQRISEIYGLELLHYDTQPIRLNHYRSYQSALLKKFPSTSSVLERKFRALTIRTMIYPMYLMERDKKNLGHTHMCALRLRA